MPVGTTLEPATPAPVSLNRGAWLSPVEITDPATRKAAELQRSLTLSIASYVNDTKYFSRVNQLPGEPRADELVLSYRFDRYELERQPHPAYFPCALLTLTLYIWFGGPIYNDVADLSGTLEVRDTSGKELALVHETHEETHSVNLWSTEYALPSSAKARTVLVRRLLDQAVVELRKIAAPQSMTKETLR